MDRILWQLGFDFISIGLGCSQRLVAATVLVVRKELFDLFAPAMKADFPAATRHVTIFVLKVDSRDIAIRPRFFRFHEFARER